MKKGDDKMEGIYSKAVSALQTGSDANRMCICESSFNPLQSTSIVTILQFSNANQY